MKRNFIIAMAVALVMVLFIPAIMPSEASAAAFADGDYTVPFTVLKDTGNEQSTTADYMVSPAKVQLTGDKATVTVTLKNSSWWQYFKVQNGGSFSDVQVVNESGDQRVVRFSVSDLTKPVNAKIHVIVTGIPGFEYDNKYDIRFNFNTSAIPAPPVEKPVTTPPPTKETKPETPKKTEEKPVQKQEQKPAGNKTETAKTSENAMDTKEKSTVKSTEKEESVQSETEKEDVTEVSTEVEDMADAIEDATSEEADAVNEEDLEELEEDAVEEVAVEVVKDEKEESSIGLFILIAAITAVVVAAIVFAFARKRARN
ncbi:NEAT domain-containing protein [Lederbergia citrisecunda]|uniref:NEAT domain-containing protein n=1 Tax=Lederbergia citrisecunda TaxID=2833583 RepID=UPI003D2AD5E3